jgi:hypothetical protein
VRVLNEVLPEEAFLDSILVVGPLIIVTLYTHPSL